MKNLFLVLFLLLTGIQQSWAQSQTPAAFGCASEVKKGTTKSSNPYVSLLMGQAMVLKMIDNISQGNRRDTVSVGFPYSASYLQNTFSGGLTVSKGYYSDYIKLSWTATKNLSSLTHFIVYRRLANVTNSFVPVATLDPTINNWQDMYSETGTLYEYKLVADGVVGLEELNKTYVSGIGFRQPMGTITGSVTYAGGTKVEGVNIEAVSDQLIPTSALNFNGTSHLDIDENGHFSLTSSSSAFTFQAWIKDTTTSGNQFIFSKSGITDCWLQNGRVYFVFSSYGTISLPYSSMKNSYFHLTAVKDANSLSLQLNNGDTVLQTKQVFANHGYGDVKSIFNIGHKPLFNDGASFKGLMDEIRIWSVALDSASIQRDYSRLLSGSETGLSAYYRCNEGSGSRVYDVTHSGYTYNQLDASLSNCTWTNETPALLKIKGITDQFGNYIISGIPYTSQGSNYTFTPIFGQHSFNPKQSNRYFSPGANTSNGVNFADESSFQIVGKVRYNNSNFPVSGAQLYIDGKPAVSRSNQIIVTADDGSYSIDVPIGRHSVSVSKSGHSFINKGFYPAQIRGNETVAFEKERTLPDFVDTTTVRLVGKVTGGDIEGNKMWGIPNSPDSIRSINNIGVATVSLSAKRNTKHYVLDSLHNNKEYFTALTDPSSGEYAISLPPEIWVVDNVKMQHDGTDLVQAGKLNSIQIDLQNVFIGLHDSATWIKTDYTDTLLLRKSTGIVDSSIGWHYTHTTIKENSPLYNKKQNFIIHNEQIMEVKDVTLGNESEFYGEKMLIQGTDTIVLSNHQLGLPLFQTGNRYDAKIKVFERFTNSDTHDTIRSTVPSINATITVKNQFDMIQNNNQLIPNLTTDKHGEAIYSFACGLPIMAQVADITQTMQIFAANSKFPSDGSPFKAYVIGAAPIAGTDFVTSPPAEVKMVLRDPPGSNSYAYIEKGSTFTTSNSYFLGSTTASTTSNKIATGFTVELGGSITGPVISTKSINDSQYSIGIESSANGTGELQKTYTFNQRFQTSADPGMVGSDADLYIGESNNMTFQKTNTLDLLDSAYCVKAGLPIIKNSKTIKTQRGKTFCFANDKSFSYGGNDQPTYFVFSQHHIVNNLIPQLIEQRNNFFLDTIHYKSFVKLDSRFFGRSNSDTVDITNSPSLKHFRDSVLGVGSRRQIGQDANHLFYKYTKGTLVGIDSVDFFDLKIIGWLNILRQNEADKLSAELIQNISYDGGVGKIENVLKETNKTIKTHSTTRTQRLLTTGVIGLTQNDGGFQLSTTSNTGFTLGSGSGNTQEQSVTFGYVLADNDKDDYYSVDVKKAKNSVTVLHQGELSEENSDFSTEVLGNLFGLNLTVNDIRPSGVLTGAKLGYQGGSYVGKKLAKAVILNAEAEELDLMTKQSVRPATQDIAQQATENILKDATQEIDNQLAASSYWLGVGMFAYSVIQQTMDLAFLGANMYKIYDKMSGNNIWNLSSFDISSPIFSVVAGRSQCPYSSEELSSFNFHSNGSPYVLNTATIQKEKPLMTVDHEIVKNILVGQKAYYTLTLINKSETGSDGIYSFSIQDGTNPDGAIIEIDGQDANRDFYVPYGQTITKTLTIAMGKPNVLNYENINILLSSKCDHNIFAQLAITAEFQKTCSPVSFGGIQDNWLVNDKNNNILGFDIKGYDLNNPDLQKIMVNYKVPSALTPIEEISLFKKNDAKYKAYTTNKDTINNRPTIHYNFNVKDLADQAYQISLSTQCADGTIYSTPYLTGKIDRQPPKVFGTPTPANGVLSPTDEISVTYNKPIIGGVTNPDMFRIEGILNGSVISHNTSVLFDGVKSNAVINDGVNLNGKSFTIEFWAKRTDPSRTDVILSQGSVATEMKIGFTATGSMYWNVGATSISKQFSYTTVYPANAWHHYACVYDATQQKMVITMDGGDNSKGQFATASNTLTTLPTGKITLGQSADLINHFKGNLHELRIWNKALDPSTIYASMSNTLSGNEMGLNGYWEMNEGFGNTVLDKARSRSMTLNTNWTIESKNYSCNFDGNNAMLRCASPINITKNDDMTMEFWFKTNQPNGSQVLFSRGIGDTAQLRSAPQHYDAMNVNYCMSIKADSLGRIHVISNNNDFVAVTNNYFDNTWHHFAVTVNRQSNMKAYVDGELQNTTIASNFNALIGNKFWLGAQVIEKNAIETDNVCSKYYNGKIDEFRIWNVSRTQLQIKNEMHNRLSGNELGLVNYLPFEAFNTDSDAYVRTFMVQDSASILAFRSYSADTIIKATKPMKDSVYNNLSAKYLVNKLASTTIPLNEISPAISLAKTKTVLSSIAGKDYNYVIGADKIIFTLNTSTEEKRAKLENTLLNITTDKMYDNSGNNSNRITWTAYVNRNPLKWSNTDFSTEMLVGDNVSFTEKISNNGGTPMNFELQNIPSWLTATPSLGSIAPLSETTITFTINNGLNTGNYDEILNVASTYGFNEPFEVKVKVKKQSPTDWVVKPTDFEFSKNIIGQLRINNVVSTNPDDILAVFVNGQCKAVASPTYYSKLDQYLVFLDIYSHTTANETLEFKVWDANNGIIRTNVVTTPQLVSFDNGLSGSIASPIIFNADNQIQASKVLTTGWNWLSFNLTSAANNDVNLFLHDVNVAGNRIHSESLFADYDNTLQWNGSITTIDTKKLYKIFVNRTDTLTCRGVYTPISPIPVANGWNWIGYLPSSSMTVNEALSSLNPTTGSIIKGQNSFAMYDQNIGWIGSLKTMKPFEGYMLKVSNSDNLIYPTQSSLKSGIADDTASVIVTRSSTLKSNPTYSVNPKDFASSMTIVGDIAIDNVSLTANDEILAFINGQCRGIANPVLVKGLNKYLLYLVVFGNDGEVSKVSFKFYDSETDQLKTIAVEESFVANKSLGFTANPYIFSDKANAEILTFGFDNLNYTDSINSTKASVVLNLLGNANVTALQANFTLSPGATAKIGTKLQESGVTTNDFSHSLIFSVISATGQVKDWNVSFSNQTGITSPENYGCSIYPNPFKNTINVSLNRPVLSLRIEITDVLGRIVTVLSKNSEIKSTEQIDLSMLSLGLYFVKIQTDNQTTEMRIIKE